MAAYIKSDMLISNYISKLELKYTKNYLLASLNAALNN